MMNPVPSKTYKLRAPHLTEHAIYFTVVGDAVPMGLFVNSKEMESFQWITALMTAYIRQIRTGTSVADIIKDMCNTFDPHGSYILTDGTNREVNSLVHHLGLTLESHCDCPTSM